MFAPKIINIGEMRVVLVKSDRQSILIEGMVASGAREEKSRQIGVAHFLEHMCGRGTKNFPGPNDLGMALDWVGGARNAYTSHEDMGFWARTAKEKWDLALKIVADQIVRPLLPEEQVEKERSIINEEIKMYEDDPSSKAGDVSWSNYFGKNAFARPILGTRSSLNKISRIELRNFKESHFRGGNTILGIVGDWEDETKLREAIESEFGDYVNSKFELNRDQFDSRYLKIGTRKLIKRKVDQAHLSIVIPSVTAMDERRYGMALINIILGSSWSSRLYKEIRLKRGLAYSVGSGLSMMSDAGVLSIGGGIKRDELSKAFELITKIVNGLSDTHSEFLLTEEDLQMAKECYKGRTSLGFDSPEKVLSTALGDILCNREVRSADMIKQEIDKIKLDDLIKLANEFLNMEKASVAVVGDFKSIDDAL